MRTRSSLLLLALIVIAATASAQQCELTDTIDKCWTRFNPAIGTEVTEPTPAEAQTQKTVAAANTGISSFVSPSGSAVKDFLTLLSASLESSSLTSNGQAFTFDYNPPINILGADHALKLQATFTKPGLNEQLTKHFSSNAAALTPFDDALTNSDDVAISGTVQPTSERFGRSLVPHRPIFRLMLTTLAPSKDEWRKVLVKVIVDNGLESEEQTFDSLPAENREVVMLAIETAAKKQQTFLRAVGGFAGKFARLLNNQPQLYATALYHARKNVVGPNELTAKLTYEIGAHNLNGFRRKHGSTCNEATLEKKETATQCARLLQTYAAGNVEDDRLTMSLEYNRTNRRWIKGDANLAGFEFGYPRAHSFVYKVTYGRTVQGVVTNTSTGRVDLSFRYEDVRNPTDSSKNVRSRGVGSITYTQKINNSFSFPVSLVYANHASDLGDVNEKFNAHFGLVYKLPTGN